MLKFIYRFCIHLSILLFISIPLQLIGIVLLLFIVPFCPKTKPLPYLFKWFDNADQYLGRDTSTYFTYVTTNGYLGKYYWLALRNPCNYFGYSVLGFQYSDASPLLIKFKPTYIKDNMTGIGDGTTDVPGYFKADLVPHYEYYWIYRYGQSKYCFRFRLGWKIGEVKLRNGAWIEQVFVISPFHSYSGL